MRATFNRFRWTSWLAAAGLAFQALVLVLQTPMEVGRGLGARPVAQATHHHGADGQPAGHHDPAQPDDACSICLGMQVAGHGVAPIAPPLPLPALVAETTVAAVAAEAPDLARRSPQNPRAPPLPI